MQKRTQQLLSKLQTRRVHAPLVKYELIKHKPHAHIALVTFNRPEKMNALTEPLAQEYQRIFHQEISTNPDVACVVVTGEGQQAFSAGNNCTHFDTI